MLGALSQAIRFGCYNENHRRSTDPIHQCLDPRRSFCLHFRSENHLLKSELLTDLLLNGFSSNGLGTPSVECTPVAFGQRAMGSWPAVQIETSRSRTVQKGPPWQTAPLMTWQQSACQRGRRKKRRLQRTNGQIVNMRF